MDARHIGNGIYASHIGRQISLTRENGEVLTPCFGPSMSSIGSVYVGTGEFNAIAQYCREVKAEIGKEKS